MPKVAYNACFGGFGLSPEATRQAREISGDPLWGGFCLKGDVCLESGEVCTRDFGAGREICRHDPILIQVIEELGDRADGMCADLALEEVPSGTAYRIDEYDGRESVVTADDYEWTVMP